MIRVILFIDAVAEDVDPRSLAEVGGLALAEFSATMEKILDFM